MIKIKNLAVSYGSKQTLAINQLHIAHGEKICLIGKSGSGKTTLIECIYQLRTYTGEIETNLQQVSFTPQKSDLIPNFKVKTNVLMARFGGRHLLHNISSLLRDHRLVNEIIAILGMSDKKDRYVNTLSGGEQQRVLIARAIYENKQIYLLDEPTSAMDIINSKNVIEVLLHY